MHHLRSAEDPVFAWLTLFGGHAAEAGIDPRTEFRVVESAVLPLLVRMIEASPGVRLADGKALPPAGGALGLHPPPFARGTLR